MSKLTRKAAIFYLILVFLAGITVGVAGRYYYAKKMGAIRPQPPKREGTFEDFIIARLTEDLKLSTNQAAAIRPIVSTNFARIDALRKETDERMNTLFEQMNGQMGEHLSEEQKAKLAEMEKRRREHFGKHGPPSSKDKTHN
jgi:hypothetical protein